MFGGFQPPQLSKEELRAAEDEASFTIQAALASAAALYFSPFLVDAFFKVF
ncbi:mitochondrial outer membrane translocase complex, subunit Tom5 [Podospora aff. communis PSN243]|uniref:Mitochondrial outer membrane translocase complex, subunit Tom5 n=1 Tax=Podospora aff. communis PSN243 TaxID=3040156 RepID=A0AAV9GR47_9PEZI|nr:mitochondrial outer membrane translocase complex, subunit Tom5 [Podospora aff. communis PSN243]